MKYKTNIYSIYMRYLQSGEWLYLPNLSQLETVGSQSTMRDLDKMTNSRTPIGHIFRATFVFLAELFCAGILKRQTSYSMI